MRTPLLLLLALTLLPLAQASAEPPLTKQGPAYPPAIEAIKWPGSVPKVGRRWHVQSGGKLVAVKAQGKELTIQHFDLNSLEETERMTVSNMPERFGIQDLIGVGERQFLFYEVWDKPNTTEQLFAAELDLVEGTLGASTKVLAVPHHVRSSWNDDGRSSYSGRFERRYGKFLFFESPDRSKLLVKHRWETIDPDHPKGHEVIGLTVFGDGLEQLWSREIVLPHPRKKTTIFDHAVDADGTVWILTAADVKRKGPGRDTITLELLRVTGEGEVEVLEPDLGVEGIVGGPWLVVHPSGAILSVGAYSRGKDGTAGFVVHRTSPQGGGGSATKIPLELDALNTHLPRGKVKKNEKAQEKGELSLPGLAMRRPLLQPDGGLLLLAEVYKIKSTSRSNYYFYEEVTSTRLDADLDLRWMRKLAKRQYGGEWLGELSFAHQGAGGHHHFVFMDEPDNHDLAADQEPSIYQDRRDGAVVLFTIDDATGATSRFQLGEVEAFGLDQLSMVDVFTPSPGVFVLEGETVPDNKIRDNRLLGIQARP